jgi:hypothetical protein
MQRIEQVVAKAGSGQLAHVRFVAPEGPPWLVGNVVAYPALS